MISVIIIDYNSMKKTIEYIDMLIKNIQDYTKLRFIIIDNSNGNENFNILNSLNEVKHINLDIFLKDIDLYKCIDRIKMYSYKNINILAIKSLKNLGYAKANNLGAMASKELFKDKYYLFSNNDLVLTKSINIKSLISPFNDDIKIAAVGPKIIGIDGFPQSPRKRISIWKQLIFRNLNCIILERLNKYTSDMDYDNTTKYAYWISGCFFVVDAVKFHEVDMFDDNTFLYGEEMILSERLSSHGYKVLFYNEIEIIHEHGVTTKNTFSLLKSEELLFKSNLYYFDKYRKSNKLTILLAIISFQIFKFIYPIKKKLKSSINNLIN